MCKRLVFFCATLGFVLSSAVQAANIIWVSDNKNGTNAPSDIGFVNLLKAQGYNVDYQGQGGTGTPGYQSWRTLDATKIAALNAADLIILSRDLSSGDYASNATEVTQWNGITKPVLMLIAHVARNDRWQWVETAGQTDGSPALQAVKTDHFIFNGVTLDANKQVNVFTGIGSISAPPAPAMAPSSPPGRTTIRCGLPNGLRARSSSPLRLRRPAGPRMLFAAGATGAGGPDGTLNLTPDGQKMFVNAVRYLMGDTADPGAAVEPDPADKATDVPSDVALSWNAGKFAATHNVYLGTDFADVNNATARTPSGMLVSQGQTETTL